MILKLHRAGSQCPPTEAVSAKVFHHRLRTPGNPPITAGQNCSPTPTGCPPATSSLARFLGARRSGEFQAIKKLGDLKQPTGMMASDPRCDL